MDRSWKRISIMLLAAGALGAIFWIAWTWSSIASEELGASLTERAGSASAPPRDELVPSEREALTIGDLAPAQVDAEAEEDHHTDVLVVDPVNRPVAGAAVTWLREDGAKSLGATAADGRLRLSATSDLIEGDAIIASKAGFGSRERFIAFPLGKELRIVLGRDAVITGTVRASPGILENPGAMTVAAVPASMFNVFGVHDCKAWLDDPRVLVARSERDGRFTLTGAAVGRKYVVEVGGTGWILAGSGVKAQGGDPPIDLVVKPLFGARIHLIGADGSAVQRVHAIGQWGIDTRPGTPDMSVSDANIFAKLLSGVPEDWFGEASDRYACLCAATKSAASLGPLLVRVHYFGYEERSLELELPRFTTVPEDIPLELTSTVDAFGWIDLAFETMPPASIDGPGCLRLRSSTKAESVELVYAARDLNGTHVRLGPMPADEYDWRFEWSPDVPTRSRREETWSKVAIAKDAVVPLLVKNELACTLAIELVDDRKARYTGPVQFLLGQSIEAPPRVPGATVMTGGNVSFRRAPYRIVGLPPGPLEVHVVGPGFVRASSNFASMTLVVGEEERVVLSVRAEP
jgi:hypothetical protein